MGKPPVAALRFRALDSWRGICALLVAAHHLEAHGLFYWQPLVRNAWLFVDFFFVLSGFVIAHAYGDRLTQSPAVETFIVRRIGRLWPLHAAVLAALIAIEASQFAFWQPLGGSHPPFSAGRSIVSIFSNLFLIQGLGLHTSLTWNGPAWSISAEFFTYVIFAFVCMATPARKPRLIVSALSALAAVTSLACFSRYGMRESFGWGLPRCVFGFFLGTLTHKVWHLGVAEKVGGTIAESLVIVLTITFIVFVPGHAVLEYFASPLFCLAVLIFAGERGFISKVLAMRAPAALGRWSYSIYMVHTLVVVVLFSGLRVGEIAFGAHWLVRSVDGEFFLDLKDSVANCLAFVAYLGTTVALAAATFRLIELPGQRFFRLFVKAPVLPENRAGPHGSTNR